MKKSNVPVKAKDDVLPSDFAQEGREALTSKARQN